MKGIIDKIKQIYRFFSPRFQNLHLEYAVDFKPRYGHGLPPHKGLLNIIAKNKEPYWFYLQKALQYLPFISEIRPESNSSAPHLPHWNNHFLPGLDIISIYTFIAHHKPAKYIEVGSGTSTKVVYKAIKDHHLNTKIISIDPQPRSEIDQISDKIIRKPFENADLEEILSLEANSILFIDNSHRVFPNSDAMVFFMEVLPQLKEGVIVHIHDVYLPYDYPSDMCERAYNEQYCLACYLLADPFRYQTLMPNYYISEDESLSSMLYPFWEHENLKNVERHGGSYWLQIGSAER